jgi:hypothetical protein
VFLTVVGIALGETILETFLWAGVEWSNCSQERRELFKPQVVLLPVRRKMTLSESPPENARAESQGEIIINAEVLANYRVTAQDIMAIRGLSPQDPKKRGGCGQKRGEQLQ